MLLELHGVSVLGSDALTLSLSLDKAWTLDVVAAAGVPTAGHLSLVPEDCESVSIPWAWPLFVKPRWEGTAKGIHTGSKVGDRASLAREVAPDRGALRPAGARRAVPAGRRVHRDDRRARSAAHAPGAAARARAGDRDRPARGRGGRRGARTTTPRVRSTRRSNARSRRRRCARSMRCAAATSRGRTSASTRTARRASSRSTRCRPLPPMARSASSPRSWIARSMPCWPRCSATRSGG